MFLLLDIRHKYITAIDSLSQVKQAGSHINIVKVSLKIVGGNALIAEDVSSATWSGKMPADGFHSSPECG
jgi:hypothetical protein